MREEESLENQDNASLRNGSRDAFLGGQRPSGQPDLGRWWRRQQLADGLELGWPAPSATDLLFFAGTTRLTATNNFAANTAFNGLTFNSGAGTFVLSGNAITLGGGITNNSTSLQTINLNLALGTTRNIEVVSAGSLTIGGVISGAGLGFTKSGAGTLMLNGANTYTGATTISAGVVNAQNNSAFGTTAGGVTVASGAALELQGGRAIGAEPLTLNGSGVSNGGALRNISGNNSWLGNITLGSATTIGSDAGTLTIGSGAAGGTISGTGPLTKVGAGTLTLSGNSFNTYSGGTIVNEGTLILNKVGGTAIPGTLTIGDGIGGVDADIVQQLLGDQIESNVTINSSGKLDLNNNNEILAAATLTMTAGNITTGTGILTLGGDVTGNAHALSATISGNLSLGGVTRTFTIANGAAAADMQISAVISGTGAEGLIKAGAGTLVFSGGNTYTGPTTVNAGVLNIQNSSALGTTANGTTVSSGAALQLQGGIAIGAEALTLKRFGHQFQ